MAEFFTLEQLTDYLDGLLTPKLFDDYCPNGLLVDMGPECGNAPVRHVVTGVSLRKELIERANEANADAIIVHHPNGWWKGESDKRVVGRTNAYLRQLVNSKIALLAYHLPLDALDVYGNNMSILHALNGNRDVCYRSFMDGVGRILDKNTAITRKKLNAVFPHGVAIYGPFVDGKDYRRIAICSGSGSSGLSEALDLGCDMFITGEVRESTPIFAEENGMVVVAAGHHRSEVFGVRNLADLLNRQNRATTAEFIDIDNPV